MPLNRLLSVDAWFRPTRINETVPGWVPLVLRFHIGLPYLMGGLAKLTPDWLLGFPMNEMMASKSSLPIIGPIAATESIGVIMEWGGLLFDLCIVPMLNWPKSRTFAYVAAGRSKRRSGFGTSIILSPQMDHAPNRTTSAVPLGCTHRTMASKRRASRAAIFETDLTLTGSTHKRSHPSFEVMASRVAGQAKPFFKTWSLWSPNEQSHESRNKTQK